MVLKGSTVGAGARVGAKCKVNSCVLMAGATVGENCTLQHTVVCAGGVVGENCNLNDCQVGPGAKVPPLTKTKGESFTADG